MNRFFICALQTGHLAMETLLSLTSKRAGDWFKEELRLLGGLDHIVDKGKRRSFRARTCTPEVTGAAAVDFDAPPRIWESHVLRVLYVCDAPVKECVQNLGQEDDKENLVASLWGAERCLRVLESVSSAAMSSLPSMAKVLWKCSKTTRNLFWASKV